MRLVLDTTSWSPGSSRRRGRLGFWWPLGWTLRFELVTAAEQVDELRRVLAYEKLKPFLGTEQVRDFVANLEALADLVKELPEVHASPDPDDDVILAIAVAGGADAVVSGDKADMLSLGVVEGVPIITARQAVERLGLAGE